MIDETNLVNTSELLPNMAEKRWAAGVHVGAMLLALLTAWMAGVAGAAGAAGVILLRPLDSEFVARHAKEAFNFNMSIFIYAILGFVVGAVFSVVTLGLGLILVIPLALVLILLMAILWLVCSIQAAMRAIEGLEYRYPVSMRLWN